MSDRPGSTAVDRMSAIVPRLGVKALVRRARRFLLVKERHRDLTPFWTLPGGGVKTGEAPEAALHRELAEELGCSVEIGDRVGSFFYCHTTHADPVSYYSVYSCTLRTRLRPKHVEGILDWRWAKPSAFPAKTLPQVRFLFGSTAGARRENAGAPAQKRSTASNRISPERSRVMEVDGDS